MFHLTARNGLPQTAEARNTHNISRTQCNPLHLSTGRQRAPWHQWPAGMTKIRLEQAINICNLLVALLIGCAGFPLLCVCDRVAQGRPMGAARAVHPALRSALACSYYSPPRVPLPGSVVSRSHSGQDNEKKGLPSSRDRHLRGPTPGLGLVFFSAQEPRLTDPSTAVSVPLARVSREPRGTFHPPACGQPNHQHAFLRQAAAEIGALTRLSTR
jgi:hypothetical protein